MQPSHTDTRLTPCTILGDADRAALRSALVDLWSSRNQANNGDRTIVDAEYLEVVGIRA